MQAYIVKTLDGYLFPFEGDVSWTPDKLKAGHFVNIGEADDTAKFLGYSRGSYEVLTVEVDEADLIRN